jgi:hypothetical protein
MHGTRRRLCRLAPDTSEQTNGVSGMYVCRRLNLGRIRKDIENSGATWNLQNSQLVCRTKNLQDQSRRPLQKNPYTLPPEGRNSYDRVPILEPWSQ